MRDEMKIKRGETLLCGCYSSQKVKSLSNNCMFRESVDTTTDKMQTLKNESLYLIKKKKVDKKRRAKNVYT